MNQKQNNDLSTPPRFYVHVFDHGQLGLTLSETIAAADRASCVSAARAFAGERAGASAFQVERDADGLERVRGLARFGGAAMLG